MTRLSSQDESSQATSESLLIRVSARESAAWQRLVDLYGPLVFSWCQRGGLQNDDAADVMQDVFVSVAKAIERFDLHGKGRFRAWLWTITRNKLHDHYRKPAPDQATGGDAAYELLSELPEQWSDECSEVTRSEVRSLYHRAMELIRTDFQLQTWQAFWMSVVEERSTEDISKELGIRPSSVRQAKSRVLRRLRAELGDV